MLVSGAGIAGPTLAYWLLRAGFTPVVVERAPARRTGGYMIDFWGIGYEVAERMGLSGALREDGYRLNEVRLVNARGRRIASMDARFFGLATRSHFVSLLRSDLARRLNERVENDVEVLFSESIAELHETSKGVTVTFERSAAREFDLVVGADGLHSRVRALAFPDQREAEHELGYYVAAFSADTYPFRDEGTYVSYGTPGRHVARYALRGGRSAFLLVWRKELTSPPQPTLASHKGAIRQVYADGGWECAEILRAMESADDVYFDTVAQVRLPDWSRGRVALVGDAAYCPSLLAGEGTGLGMAGAYVLARCLASTGSFATAYREYQRSFKPFVDGKQASASRMGSWFAPRTRLGVHMRNLSTRLLSIPGLARLAGPWLFQDRYTLPA